MGTELTREPFFTPSIPSSLLRYTEPFRKGPSKLRAEVPAILPGGRLKPGAWRPCRLTNGFIWPIRDEWLRPAPGGLPPLIRTAAKFSTGVVSTADTREMT